MGRMALGGDAWGLQEDPEWIIGKLVQASSSRLAASSVPSISSQVSAALCQTLSSLSCLFFCWQPPSICALPLEPGAMSLPPSPAASTTH